MQIYLNQDYIKRRATIGKWTTGVALVVLLAGSIISFSGTVNLLPVALVCLLIGFIGANMGSYYMRRFVRKPRPDEVIANSLKGLDDRYEFFAWTLPAANVLLSPAGLYVMVTRDQQGAITASGNRWRQPFSLLRFMATFSQEALGNPGREAQEEAARVKKWLQQRNPELQIEPQPLVVFIADKTQLTLENPDTPALLVKDLKDFLRKKAQEKETRLPDAVRKLARQTFSSPASA